MNEYKVSLNHELASSSQKRIEQVRSEQLVETKRHLHADILAGALMIPESRSAILLQTVVSFPSHQGQGLFILLRKAYISGTPFNSPDLIDDIKNYKDYLKQGKPALWEGSLHVLKNDKLIADMQMTLLQVFDESNALCKARRDGVEVDAFISAYELNDQLEKLFMMTRDRAFSESDNKPAVEIAQELTTMVEDAKAGRTHEIQWGIHGLNSIVPLRNAELTIVGARSGHGKTAFVISCMLNQVLKHEYKIGGYFGELLESRIYARLLAIYANENKHYKDYKVTYNAIFQGFCERNDEGKLDIKKHDKDAYNQFIVAKNYLTKAFADNLFIKSKTIYLADLVKNIRDLKQSHDIACYYVDYVQWIETKQGDARDKKDKIEEVIRTLNALSTELNIPIVVLAQLNRGAHNERPQSNHISGSDIPFNECDNMILLDMPIKDRGVYNDRKYEFDGVKAELSDFYNSVVLNVAKQRDGANQGEAFLFGFDSPIAKVTRHISLENKSFTQTVIDHQKKQEKQNGTN